MTHPQPHSGAAQQAARILRSLTAGGPLRLDRELPGERRVGRAAECLSSLELERRELLESIVENLSGSRPPARSEASVQLLLHLAGEGLEGSLPARASGGPPTRFRRRVHPLAGPSCGRR